MLGQMQFLPDGETGDKVDMAIRCLKSFEPEEGYYLAFSGGKDSQCIYHLCEMAGVKFDAHYSVTSIDPPEVVRFIKKNYPDVAFEYPRDRDGKVVTMWNLIPRKQMPPTRIARYCCAWFKETNGKDRITVTGVRWDESANRAANHGYVDFIGKKKSTQKKADELGAEYRVNKHGSVILNNDNTENRQLVEFCYRNRKTLVNPIINWTDSDVWEFLNWGGWEHCCLYDQGKKRIGCIGCPMNTAAAADLEAYPVYKKNYLKAFERMIENNKKNGIKMNAKWKDAQGVMNWWLKQEGNEDDEYPDEDDADRETWL